MPTGIWMQFPDGAREIWTFFQGHGCSGGSREGRERWSDFVLELDVRGLLGSG
jgi:hypothetical protein